MKEGIDRIKRTKIVDEKDRDKYFLDLVDLYPWLFVDFEIEESMINDDTTGENQVT